MSNKKEQYTVKLQVFRGQKLKKEDGTMATENQSVSLQYGTLEWKNYLINAPRNFGVVEVVDVHTAKDVYEDVEIKGKATKIRNIEYTKVDAPKFIINEVKEAFKPKSSKSTETDDQKRIKELEARLLALESGATSTDKKAVNTELEVAKSEYIELFGKKPHHSKSLEIIKTEIENKKKENAGA